MHDPVFSYGEGLEVGADALASCAERACLRLFHDEHNAEDSEAEFEIVMHG